MGQCMAALKTAHAPTTYAVLGGFLQTWTWPRRMSPLIDKLLNVKAIDSHTNANSLRFTARELMTLVPAISFYLVNVAL